MVYTIHIPYIIFIRVPDGGGGDEVSNTNDLNRNLRTAPADAHGISGRARHHRTRTAPADTHGIGGRARHQRTRTARALADAHGTGGRARPGH